MFGRTIGSRAVRAKIVQSYLKQGEGCQGTNGECFPWNICFQREIPGQEYA